MTGAMPDGFVPPSASLTPPMPRPDQQELAEAEIHQGRLTAVREARSLLSSPPASAVIELAQYLLGETLGELLEAAPAVEDAPGELAPPASRSEEAGHRVPAPPWESSRDGSGRTLRVARDLLDVEFTISERDGDAVSTWLTPAECVELGAALVAVGRAALAAERVEEQAGRR